MIVRMPRQTFRWLKQDSVILALQIPVLSSSMFSKVKHLWSSVAVGGRKACSEEGKFCDWPVTNMLKFHFLPSQCLILVHIGTLVM